MRTDDEVHHPLCIPRSGALRHRRITRHDQPPLAGEDCLGVVSLLDFRLTTAAEWRHVTAQIGLQG